MVRTLCSYLLFVFLIVSAPAHAENVLPSWNDTAAKQRIVEFVSGAVEEGGPAYVEPAERIAVFDNDGTLWSEQPVYFQHLFAIDKVRELAPQHPEWKENPVFAAAISGDLKKVLSFGEEGAQELIVATHSGMSVAEFKAEVRKWLATAKHPVTGRPYTEMVYQPMLELLRYLRANGFKTFIVSGGGIEFIRSYAEEAYGIPPEQVVGTMIKTEFEIKDGRPELFRLPEMFFINDQAGKPVGISYHIGRQPVAAFGNSDGDLQMLQWTAAGRPSNLCLLVHHTDPQREWAYDHPSEIGQLDKALDEAKVKGWVVVDMREDWNKIYQ